MKMKIQQFKAALVIYIFSAIVLFILLLLTNSSVKPMTFIIIVFVILLLEADILDFIYKKEMLFFKRHIQYDKKNIGIRYFRYLCLLTDISIIFLLIFFVFFNKSYLILLSLINKETHAIRGGVKTYFIICLLGSAIYWIFFIIKRLSNK